MALKYSTELNQGPPGSPQTYLPLKPNQYQGRVRISDFSLTLASETSGQVWAVMMIPKGARIISGAIIASTTLANSATLAVGLMGADGSGYYDDSTSATAQTLALGTQSQGPLADSTAGLKAAAAQSTSLVSFALTQALGFLYELQKACYITLTSGTGTVSTETVTGYCFWVLD